MWPVSGTPKETDLFGKLEPVQVLGWYDGPRTFTLTDKDGGLCLAHWLDEDRDLVRFIVVPVSTAIMERLERGELTLREGLDQPRVYVVDQENSGAVKAVWLTCLQDLPADALPVPGTMLHRDLEPLVNGAIATLPAVRETTVQLIGSVRELDADKLHFLLRNLENEADPGRVCHFEPDLWDDVYDLLGVDAKVKIVGRQSSPGGVVQVIDLSLMSDAGETPVG